MDWLTFGSKWVAIIGGGFIIIRAVWPWVIGDYPLLANIERVNNAKDEVRMFVREVGNDIRVDLLTGRIFNLRKEQCLEIAQHGNTRLATSIGDQIRYLVGQVEFLLNTPYQVLPCDQF